MSDTPSAKSEPKQKPQIWKKGQSGNPAGRPPGTISLVSILKKKLAEVEPHTKKQYADLLIERMTKMAIAEGSESQIKNILQYVDGMPKQQVDVTSDGEKINFTVYSPTKRPEPEE